MAKCKFCGSKDIIVEDPYVELKDSGDYGTVKRYCCKAQKANAEYRKKHYHPLIGNPPPTNEIGEL